MIKKKYLSIFIVIYWQCRPTQEKKKNDVHLSYTLDESYFNYGNYYGKKKKNFLNFTKNSETFLKHRDSSLQHNSKIDLSYVCSSRLVASHTPAREKKCLKFCIRVDLCNIQWTDSHTYTHTAVHKNIIATHMQQTVKMSL